MRNIFKRKPWYKRKKNKVEWTYSDEYDKFAKERLRKLREISANQIKKVNKDVHGIDPDSYEVVWEEDHKILLDLRDDEQVKWNNRNEDRDYE